MSKVISFSISDKYLEKLRTLYPHLTDNLAVKQFVTDRLDGSLGNSLDGSLDDAFDDALDDNLKTLIESSLSSTLDDVLDETLDGKLKTLIESELDGLLEGRLDANVGKLLTSLSERMARLEERLDDSLGGSLDVKLDYGLPYQPSKNELTDTQRRVLESRQLTKAKLEHAAYLVKHPLVVRDLTKKQPIETVTDTVESVDESDTSPLPNQENVETVDTVEDAIELDKGAIGPVGMNAADAAKYLKDKKVKVSDDSLYRWIRQEKIPDSHQGRDAIKHLTLINKLYYPIN